MTAVFSATWQSLRLGLEASSFGRAAFSALRTTLSTSRQSAQPLQHFRNLQRSSYCTHNLSSPARDQRHKLIVRPNISLPIKQSRWASLWKPVPKPQEEEATEFEIHEDEIRKIFGNSMDPQKGTEVLMALQIRRIEGTLDQKLEYPDAWMKRGLGYLRARFPMDEDAAVIARIDREIESSIRASRTNMDPAVSQFEVLRRRNKQKEIERRRREAEEEKELESKGNNGTKGMQNRKTSAPDVAGRQRPPMPEWVRKYREKTEQMESRPDITTVQRLLPSGLLVVIVVTLSLLFAKYYKPPSRDARLFPELPPAAATVLTIIAANVLVFFMWRMMPPLWPLMYTTFAVAPMYPYARTMLGASFSHQKPMHLFMNMFILWMLGTRLHDDIGRGPFLALYFASAALGAYIPMVVYVLTNNLGTGTIGASVCISAIIAASCVLHEGRTIHLQGVPDGLTQYIDTGAFLALNVLVEILALRRNGIKVPQTGSNAPKHQFDHMGHLTGFAVGIIAGIMVRLKDPKWKAVKREHWYSNWFTRKAEESRRP